MAPGCRAGKDLARVLVGRVLADREDLGRRPVLPQSNEISHDDVALLANVCRVANPPVMPRAHGEVSLDRIRTSRVPELLLLPTRFRARLTSKSFP